MFEEELQHHLLMGLDHLKFAREMLIRVGTPAGVEAFNRHGWSFGEEVYTGLPETQVVEDQMNTVFEMTEARLAADLYFIDYLNEGREEWYRGVLHAGSSRVRDPNELPLHDLDFAHALVVSSSDAGLVENYRRGSRGAEAGTGVFHLRSRTPEASIRTTGQAASPAAGAHEAEFPGLCRPVGRQPAGVPLRHLPLPRGRLEGRAATPRVPEIKDRARRDRRLSPESGPNVRLPDHLRPGPAPLREENRVTQTAQNTAVSLEIENTVGGHEEPVESATLTLTPTGVPTVKITRGGIEIPKTCSLLDLLGFLDESSVLEALKLPPYRTASAPPLPPRALLLSTVDFPEDVHHVVTGWMPPARYPFVLRDDRGNITTHSVPLPVIVYRAYLGAKDRKLRSLALTLAPDFPEDGPTVQQLKTPLYRYPFSNVYEKYGGVMEAACWPTIDTQEMALSEVPEKGVHTFLSIPNNADLYGVGTTHNAPYRGYHQLLGAVEEKGLEPGWLIPARMDVAGLHNQKRKKGVV